MRLKHIMIAMGCWLLAMGCWPLSTLQAQPYWNNLEVYRLNKVQPHDRIVPEGEWRMSLNGIWHFAYFNSPQEASQFSTLNSQCKDTIRVPGNVELQGFGVPVYVNMKNEFPSNPPHAPVDYNPTYIYARMFTLPSHWQGRRTIVKFGAVKSAMYLYVNGREVGYSEDSKTPAEWDITRYLREGKNEMKVKVLRWCDGSYLECQDMWRMSGITRDVELYSVPRTYISDIKVIADLDTHDWKTGLLDITVDLNREVSGGKVEVVLETGDKELRKQERLGKSDWFVGFQMRVPDVQPWNDSVPALYDLTVKLFDASGHETERVVKKIGFRHLDIVGGQLRLNGKAMEIRGVNRHEHSASGGHYITPDEMRQDIALMKQLGINAVRTCHYPNDELWYDLCDSAGIYVWDEANVESHAQGYGEGSLAKKKEWLNPILDRIYNMYKRDRNHPCVIAWSLGNECGNGYCFEEAYRFLKGKDNTRPVVYERAELAANTDIVSVMYPSVEFLSEYARNPKNTRPYIIAEYCHAMGNSMGGLKDYWDTIDKYPQLQGGFIWDWVDQAFLVKSSELKDNSCWAAGGDLGELPGIKDDGTFCCNGILAADRTLHPHANEVEAVYTRGKNNVKPHSQGPLPSPLGEGSGVRLEKHRGEIVIHSGLATLRMNSRTGDVTSLRYHGKEMLAAPLRCNFWRPPTENDLVDVNGARAWQGLESLAPQVLSVTTGSSEVQTLIRFSTPDGNTLRVRQIIEASADGAFQLSYLVVPCGNFRTLPKLGLQLGLDTSFAYCRFQGNLYETYPDRREAQRVARWRKSMAEMAEPQYVKPQEQGNREASWVRFETENTGSGDLLFAAPESQGPLNFSVRRYDDNALAAARRWCDVEPADHYVVNIDYRQAGLGTATCGPGVADRFLISGDSSYCYRFTMMPIGSSDELRLPDFQPHPDLTSGGVDVEGEKPEYLKVKTVACNMSPASQYSEGFPMALVDGRRAVPGNYRQGWAGFEGADTVVLVLTLDTFATLGQISVGSCHSPADWVVKPYDIQAQWSIDGKSWSPWQSLELRNAPSDLYSDSRRLRYVINPKRAKAVHFVRLRAIACPTLPIWHPYSGQKAWFMIDEIEVKAGDR